ncbi:alternative ribosome rescue aminoacyl-tRNA hydrolase ArfB [Oceanihabitans sp. 2_MG-2023]|uniref:alternative ribosome rescue aminoacyl-tRNA hydrolase ArfB n=1 Tax=Oceanihabitans sp. 2_MG-2023 TaxID=3062661 RepID=UPI0026E402A5|nr:alternative ribosome rescue aminoacyl-tRNA hydrolase ArfB [Oceanihabitans sp. 2_MG-2023]MDO6595534.1 alternative ribosome rescue aminoacyl-tRNA hydrolase ArfB [Oceanihabitans sp. 2_MG-2023]
MFHEQQLIHELRFKAIRSSGAGGQHVNKVSSKIELTFNLEDSQVLNEDQKQRLKIKLHARLTKENVLLFQCGESRSQHKNKQIAIKRFLQIIKEGLVVPKRRKPTKIPKAVKIKRLKSKRVNSEKKANRKKPNLD